MTPRELAEREWAQRAPPRRRRSEERIRQEGEKGKSPRSAAEALGGRISGEGTDEDWLSKMIEYLWPKIRQVTQDMAWEMVPRKS